MTRSDDLTVSGDAPGPGSPATSPAARERRPRTVGAIVVILLVTGVAGWLRFANLSYPKAYVFDEIYYAKDGCFDAGFPYRQCHLQNPGEQTYTVHPPLGRWAIAGSEAAFGNRTFGWRFGSALAGTLSVFFLGLLAWRLFRSVLWAGVAAALLCAENLNFVESRISMLDIFLTLFVVLGFLFLVLDREWIERRTPAPAEDGPEPQAEAEAERAPAPPAGAPHDTTTDGGERTDAGEADRARVSAPSPVFRPWRLAAGVAFGAAAATKWSGAGAAAAGVLLAVLWERTRRRRLGDERPLAHAIMEEGFGVAVFLGLVPIAVYLLSYLRFWVDNGLDPSAIHAWWTNQVGMLTYSLHLRATHPYASKAWSWLLLKRPVAYYYVCHRMSGGVCARPAEILALGNPLLFWGTLFTIPYVAFAWIRKRDWRCGLIILAFGFQYLPWLGVARTSFLFYLTPVTPFMVLAATYAMRDLASVQVAGHRSKFTMSVAGLLIVATIATFVFFLPVMTGKIISYDQWRARMWYGRCTPKATWCWI